MVRILIGPDARRAVGRSLSRSVRAIAASTGSEARAVLYDRAGQVAIACTGFEIAREAADEAGEASIGARILKETLAEAQRELGDGTARLACLIGGAFAEAVRLVESGIPAGALADAMLRVPAGIEGLLREGAAEPSENDALACLAPDDAELRDAVATARAHAGATSHLINVRQDPRAGIWLETGRGFALDATPLSAWMPPHAPDAQVELMAPYVLVVNETLEALGRLEGLLEAFATRGKALAIFARGARSAALETLVANVRAFPTSLAALQPSQAGIHAMAALEDLATATGATIVGQETGLSLDLIGPAVLGRAVRLVVRPRLAVFEDPTGDDAAIEARCRALQVAWERERHLSLDRERTARRIARLRGAWAELRIGGATARDTERRLAAARAALAIAAAAAEGGSVAGGGMALDRLAARFENDAKTAADLTGRGARRAVAAGCRAASQACLGPRSREQPRDPLPILAGIVRRGVSAAATMLRIESIVVT